MSSGLLSTKMLTDFRQVLQHQILLTLPFYLTAFGKSKRLAKGLL